MTKGPEYWHSRRLSITLIISIDQLSSSWGSVGQDQARLGSLRFRREKKKKTSPMRPASDPAVLQDRLERRPGHTRGQNQGKTQGQGAHIHLHFLEVKPAAGASSSLSSCAFSSFPLCSPRSLQGPGQSGFIHRRKRRSGEEDGEGRTRAELGESFVAEKY